MTLFSCLRELEKKATPKPWITRVGDYICNKYIDNGMVLNNSQQMSDDNRLLIIEMRNDLPKIFEVLDLYEAALKEICAGTGRDFTMSRYVSKTDLENDKGISLDDAHSAAAEALKRAKEISGE